MGTFLIYSLAGAYCKVLLSGPNFVDIQIHDKLYERNEGRTKNLYIYDAARKNIIDKIRVRFPRE